MELVERQLGFGCERSMISAVSVAGLWPPMIMMRARQLSAADSGNRTDEPYIRTCGVHPGFGAAPGWSQGYLNVATLCHEFVVGSKMLEVTFAPDMKIRPSGSRCSHG